MCGCSNEQQALASQTVCLRPTCVLLCGAWPAGSGKTLAYMLPLLARLASGSDSSSAAEAAAAAAAAAAVQPHALVLLPSRELAQQVHSVAAALFVVTAVSSAVVYGGVPREQQVRACVRGVLGAARRRSACAAHTA
jgi:superfamily II DNA/RNA helicase